MSRTSQPSHSQGLSGRFSPRGRSRFIGTIILAADLQILELDESVEKLWPVNALKIGSKMTDLLNNNFHIHKDGDMTAEEWEGLVTKVIKSGVPQSFIIEYSRSDVHKWFMAEAMRVVDDADTAGLQITVVDISKQKNYEGLLHRQMAEISDQNRQWQAIYSSMLESIVLLDTNGRVTSMNPATEKITGVKASEGIGQHVGEIFPKVDATVPGLDSKGRSGLDQTLEDRRPSDLYESVVATKDGRHIWINYTYTPLRDAKGKITALVRVTSDVSTVKAVEQMKNDFVSIASHELRTPLGVINSYLNLFLHGQLGELTESQKTYIKRVFDASDDMSALVEDLLNMSRIESGRLELASQSFYIRDVVNDVISFLEQKMRSKNITAKITHLPEKEEILADRQKLEQALTNIIDNAIKYTYDGGNITVAIKHDNDWLEVSVTDSGVGINPENLGHIFEKFYREGNPLSVKEGGSGLGLYISRKLIELHGGSISVASKQGKGSTFTVRLPIALSTHKR